MKRFWPILVVLALILGSEALWALKSHPKPSQPQNAAVEAAVKPQRTYKTIADYERECAPMPAYNPWSKAKLVSVWCTKGNDTRMPAGYVMITWQEWLNGQ